MNAGKSTKHANSVAGTAASYNKSERLRWEGALRNAKERKEERKAGQARQRQVSLGPILAVKEGLPFFSFSFFCDD